MDSSPSPSSMNRRRRRLVLTSPAEAVSGKTCPICLCHIPTHRASVISPCMHPFCHHCLLLWTSYKRRCPLCNAPFLSYFSNLNHISPRTFHKHNLPPLSPPPPPPFSRFQPRSSNRSSFTTRRWRSFNRDSDAIIRWRASIYAQRLRAIPDQPSTAFVQRTSRSLSSETIEGIRRRIQSWIRRELIALLNDSDPTLLLHVATELFVRAVERSASSSSSSDQIPDFRDHDLRRFLQDRTDMFWHELRCFHESRFNIDAYDERVEYQPLNY